MAARRRPWFAVRRQPGVAAQPPAVPRTTGAPRAQADTLVCVRPPAVAAVQRTRPAGGRHPGRLAQRESASFTEATDHQDPTGGG
jgi:hypothetical protein